MSWAFCSSVNRSPFSSQDDLSNIWPQPVCSISRLFFPSVMVTSLQLHSLQSTLWIFCASVDLKWLMNTCKFLEHFLSPEQSSVHNVPNTPLCHFTIIRICILQREDSHYSAHAGIWANSVSKVGIGKVGLPGVGLPPKVSWIPFSVLPSLLCCRALSFHT